MFLKQQVFHAGSSPSFKALSIAVVCSSEVSLYKYNRRSSGVRFAICRVLMSNNCVVLIGYVETSYYINGSKTPLLYKRKINCPVSQGLRKGPHYHASYSTFPVHIFEGGGSFEIFQFGFFFIYLVGIILLALLKFP